MPNTAVIATEAVDEVASKKDLKWDKNNIEQVVSRYKELTKQDEFSSKEAVEKLVDEFSEIYENVTAPKIRGRLVTSQVYVKDEPVKKDPAEVKKRVYKADVCTTLNEGLMKPPHNMEQEIDFLKMNLDDLITLCKGMGFTVPEAR